MTDSQDEDPGGPNMGSPWHFFIWKPPSLSWVFSSNDSHYNNKISKPDGSNHQSLECVNQSSKQHKLEAAHSTDYCRGAIDGSCAPAGQHACTGRHYSTPAQSCTVSSEGGQLWYDIEPHTTQGPQNTSASTQISHYPSSQHDSGDLGKALDKLCNGEDQPLVGRIILPTNWRSVFTSHKHHQDLLELLDEALISLDSASFAPLARISTLLEKAILRPSFTQRYIGLYPHSADPPIHTKEKTPEHPPKRLTIHRAHHQRPVRSKKNQFHSQPSSKRSLLVYLLQLARAFTSIFIATPLFYRVNKTLNTKKTHLELYIGKMDRYILDPEILGQLDPDFLESFVGGDLLYFPDPSATSHTPILTDSNYPLDIDFAPFYSHQQYSNQLLPPYANQFSPPLSPNSIDSPMDPPTDLPGFGFDDFVTMPSPSPLLVPTPASVEVEDLQLQSEDTLIGPPITPMSESVTPQNEGLATPTFTPIGSSPETVTSPLTNPQQTHVCPEESCGHKRFARRCDLNKHLKTHNKNLECHHPACDKRFSTEKDRKRHFSTVHEGEKRFACDLCGGKRFSRQDNLKDHKRRIHGVK